MKADLEGPGTLAEQTSQLSEEMADLLRSVFPDAPDFEVELVGSRSVVRPVGDSVPLSVGRKRLAALEISMSCCLDSVQRYLAVEKSHFKLYADIDRTPILRFDYVREMRTKPHAHIQVHGHRGALSHLLSQSGHATPHDMSSLHLPVGGSRFRPCLEDIIQFLITECGVDYKPGWRQRVEEGRDRWRRRQIAAATRAVPSEAARVLTELGYRVELPRTAAGDSSPALRNW
ncbi:MAG TPA: hypothetical protein VLJ59_13250 [Mycobacteriales bacterium]|nr:hypothetical protein [Mycobacteriales bacterium]